MTLEGEYIEKNHKFKYKGRNIKIKIYGHLPGPKYDIIKSKKIIEKGLFCRIHNGRNDIKWDNKILEKYVKEVFLD